MKIRNLIASAAVALLPLAASAATLVIPAAGTGAGVADSQWQSEVTLHNSAPRDLSLSMTLHVGKDVLGPVALTIGARHTVSIADIAHSRFGLAAGTGALVIDVADKDARSLAVTSRTFNTTPTAEYGQDIPAVNIIDAATAGDIAALNGPSDAAAARFNFGVYAISASSVKWELVRADGTVAGSTEVSYAAGEHAQYGFGVQSLIGVTPASNDTVQARVTSGNAIFYGSIINATGDPTFVPGLRTRDDITIHLTGIDLDENGTVDISDANDDGVLDAPVQIATSLVPAFFRIVAAGEFGETVTFEVVSITNPAAAALVNSNGTVRVGAPGELRNQTGQLVVRATAEGTSTTFTIPVKFE